jgi:hypothetical protein
VAPAAAVQQHTTSKRAADDFCALQKVFNFSPFVSIIVCCLHALHTNQPHKLHMERGAFLVFPSRTRSVFIVLQRSASRYSEARTQSTVARLQKQRPNKSPGVIRRRARLRTIGSWNVE